MNFSSIEIPLKYVLIGLSQKLVPKKGFLTFTDENLIFECYKCSDTRNLSTTFQIEFKDITIMRFALDNCLFNITLKDEVYRNFFGNSSESVQLFFKTVWFCLDFPNLLDYQRSLNNLINHANFELRLYQMSQEISVLFIETAFRIKIGSNFICNWDNFTNFKNDANESKSIICKHVNLAVTRNDKRKRDDFNFENDFEEKYTYSPSPNHSIEIGSVDFKCLKENNYINDNIINLYLMYIYHDIMTKEQRQNTYIFNSFFYTKLLGTKCDNGQSRHKNVEKWTKNVDIFTKDFLVIPVCERGHWILVIVCFPWMCGMVDYNKNFTSLIPKNNSKFATKSRIQKLESLKEKNIHPMPCILILDSLMVNWISDKVEVIHEYLQCEWNAKRQAKDGFLLFNKATMIGYLPNLLPQENSTDCGVFLLYYAESFFKFPIKQYNYDFFEKAVNLSWEPQDSSHKRKEVLKTILRILNSHDVIIIDE